MSVVLSIRVSRFSDLVFNQLLLTINNGVKSVFVASGNITRFEPSICRYRIFCCSFITEVTLKIAGLKLLILHGDDILTFIILGPRTQISPGSPSPTS
jgi:hypothetical protein